MKTASLVLLAVLTACQANHVPGYLQRQNVPYVLVDGQATTLGGQSGTIGQVTAPVLVQVGHEVAVMAARIGWPSPFSSDPSVLRRVGGAGLGVFKAERVGNASLLMRTSACVRPQGADCVFANIVVTDAPVPRTSSPPEAHPTTSNLP